MLKLSCPACSAEIQFKSKASVFAICSYCKSTVLRRDLNLELYGKMSEFQDELTPFQIGTKGIFEKQSFELLGYLRMAWNNGFWNEWYALLQDGREAWLAEAQGFYALSFPQSSAYIPNFNDLFLNGTSQLKQKQIILQDILYSIDDVKETTCLASFGELPFKAPEGRQSLNIDLSASNSLFACIEYSLDSETLDSRFYIGRYLEFDDLQFSNLREIEGWHYE